jgi:hypothetical protein
MLNEMAKIYDGAAYLLVTADEDGDRFAVFAAVGEVRFCSRTYRHQWMENCCNL